MFYEKELHFLQNMLDKCSVHSEVINPNEPIHNYMDTIPLDSRDFQHTFRDFFPDYKSATVYRLIDVFLCRFIFLELPYMGQPSVLLIGPYLTDNLTHQQILEQAERMGQTVNIVRNLELFYQTIPVVQEEHHLFAMVSTLAETVFAGEDSYSTADLYFHQSAVTLTDFSQDKAALNNEQLDVELMESRYRFENQLMAAVGQGNSHKAEMILASISHQSFESRTADPLRNAKNYCIIMNTLMRKSAEQGGVHPVHLDRVSSDYARRIEAMCSLAELNGFMQDLVRSYCQLVKRHSTRDYSPLVQKATILIEGDLSGDLRLSSVAAKNNVSAGYLSGLFKKEIGQTFTSYVNSRRVAMAKRLLKTTHLQIQTIAQHCGILDFHYICRIFKRHTGMTPTEYRSSNAIGSES